MATHDARDRLQPVLLDRLTDLAPASNVEADDTRVMNKAQIRDAVLRDLVWSAAQLEFSNGGGSVALVPTRYPGTAEQPDNALRLARRTEWLELGATHFRGLGQRVLTTSAADADLLQVREIVLQPEPEPEQASTDSSPTDPAHGNP